MSRCHNFNPGPAALPEPVLATLSEAVRELPGQGMSILEISHRSQAYLDIYERAVASLQRLLKLDSRFDVLFLSGGASTQFAMLPLNLLQGRSADYILTGEWSEKAFAEAQRFSTVRVAASGKGSGYTALPRIFDFDPQAAYVHFTSNNTIYGTEWLKEPEIAQVPLICDASSDFLSRPLDMSLYSMIYAGAQKNLGPAGVTVVVIDRGLIPENRREIPAIWDYKTHMDNKSNYNTPPVFAIYAVALVLEWLEERGGLGAIEAINRDKAAKLYAAIDGSQGYYRGLAQKDSRSRMNVVFRLPNEGLEKRFVAEAEKAGLVGLKGHRALGGMRASLYNAVSSESVDALVAFMAEFQRKNA